MVFLYGEDFLAPAQLPSWRTTAYWLSASNYSIYTQ